ncbi:DUF547 domain-containing protein [Henriciella sp. AS95]|uniref:DUF547 domain-containing protein n=1 Tax=Henriciella sp. AS95 TaxID=3135782 RepID=UPI0031812BEB
MTQHTRRHNRSAPSLFAGLALLLASPAAFAQTAGASDDAWMDILETYVHESEDGINRVDYGALKANAADVSKLDAYIEQFADLDIDALPRDEQFASWANLYNAVTVRYIVRKYPTSTIKPWYSSGPWKTIKVMADGREVSLDAIEHEILRAQWEGDPRLHYAINCASLGCPNLMDRPWEAETLDEDLNAAARAYINHPRGVSVTGNGLRVSSIYDWFKSDFGGTDAQVIDHFLIYADPDLARQIEANPDIRGYGYNWSLNDTSK